MSARIRAHIRSNIIGYVALFIALSGTAYATHPGGANTISSADIIDNQVQSADVRNDTLSGGGLAAADLKPSSVGTSEVAPDALGSGDLAPSSVGSSEVASDSLSGSDINESGLGIVPNADKLDGLNSTGFVSSSRVQRIHWRVETPAVTDDVADILTYGPVRLEGFCEAPTDPDPIGGVFLRLDSNAAASANWFFVEGATVGENGLAMAAADPEIPVKSTETGRFEGTLLYDWAGGTISVALHAFHTYVGFSSLCEIYGTVLHTT